MWKLQYHSFLHPPRINPNRLSNYAKYFHEIRTDRNDFTAGLKHDDNEKLEELNNLNWNVYYLIRDKTIQLYVFENKDKKSRQPGWKSWGQPNG